MLKPAQSLNIKDSSAVTNSIDGSDCYQIQGFPEDSTVFIDIQNLFISLNVFSISLKNIILGLPTDI